jgi:hypothetical protein
MKDINLVRTDFDRAVSGSYDRNRQVVDDIRFAKVPGAQWNGSDYDQYQNKPKPENNKIAKQVNRLLGQYERLEMNAKIISNSDEATDDDAEILQSRWRNDFNVSDGIEALNNAADEAFHGGFGAFKLVAKYEDEEKEDEEYQNLNIEPIYSAASTVVFNAGALRKDKRDAKQAWNLIRVNRHETEEEFGVTISSYPEATSDYNYFDWYCESGKDVYIAHYYEVIKKTITVYEFVNGLTITRDGRKLTDQMGNKFDRDIFDELKENVPYEETKKKTQYVEYALLSGDQFLIKPRKTPFKTIPIIPQYGYHQILNGVEYYCGEVARQRDNQRFLNMGFGSMMEIMAQPQVETPEYTPEQIQRFATQRANHTVENYSYLMSDPVKDKAGNIVHMGPIGKHMPPQLGTGLSAALQFLDQNIDEQGGTGQSTLPSNASGDAVRQVNERQDDSYQPLYQNAMQSLKAACQTWIPAAKELYFSNERTIRLEGPDGSYSQIMTLQYQMDDRTGQYGPFKNSARRQYDVVGKVGESHKAKKEADRQANLEILQYTDTNTPMGQLTLNNLILTTTGEDTADARRIARFQNLGIMLDMGIDPQPKTDEERQHVERLMQMKQQQQPQQDPNVILAQAEAKARLDEGQAALQNEVNDAEKNRIELIKLQLKDKELNIKAAEVGAKVENIQIDSIGKQLDNRNKIIEGNGKQIDNVTKLAQPMRQGA